MSCEDACKLMHAYVDGELDLVRSLEIEGHLHDCQTCAQAYNDLRSLHSAVSIPALRFEPTNALRDRVRMAIRDESKVANRSLRPSWRWIIPAASVAALAIIAWSALAFFGRPSTSDLLAQEIVSGHVRSMMEKDTHRLMCSLLTSTPSSHGSTAGSIFHRR